MITVSILLFLIGVWAIAHGTSEMLAGKRWEQEAARLEKKHLRIVRASIKKDSQ